MDLNTAAQAHSEWKVKLRMAIQQKSKLDVATVASDRCCALGKWLHGDAKGQFAKLKPYADCVTKHADFHRAAGTVAAAINQEQFVAATAMLEAGTPYANASSAVGSAILGLKKAIAATV